MKADHLSGVAFEGSKLSAVIQVPYFYTMIGVSCSELILIELELPYAQRGVVIITSREGGRLLGLHGHVAPEVPAIPNLYTRIEGTGDYLIVIELQ